MFEAGIRFDKDLHLSVSLDPTNGDCYVIVQLITDEGETHVLSGSVVWDE